MKEVTNKIARKFNVFLLLALLIPVSCSDFLEKPLQGQLTQQNFPVTSSDALMATNAVYHTLRDPSFHFGLFPILDIMSDDARKGSNGSDQASTIGPYDSFKHINTESTMAAWWSTLYLGVRAANVVIEKVPLITMDDNLKNRYIGEASFLRAVYYFDLVRGWGDVPLILKATVNDTNIPRAPKDSVYQRIKTDLLLAIDGLPEKSGYGAADMGRATKGAAKSLLAKVYLFQNDFVNAEKYALDVINTGNYSLEPDFEDANGVNGQYGPESIFEIGALPLEGQENGGDQYGNVQGVRGTPNRGWGFNRPSMDLMHAYESGDPRKDKTIIFLGEVLNDTVTIIGDSATPDLTKDTNGDTVEIECYNQKVWTPGTNVPTQFEHHRRLIRYDDVLLMAAEASNENGKNAQALLYLNQIRARARSGNAAILLDVTESDKDLLRDIILKERRIELALEGHRFWDLVRTGKAAAVLGPLGFESGKHELLAIPQTEIDLSHNTLTQNPGWQ